MVATAEAAANSAVTKLGFAAGQVVQEIGYDDDVDDDLRIAIEDVIGSELEDEDYGDVADAVTLWWREDDGDLTDALVDALTNLADRGFIVLLSPKAGRPGTVEAERHRGGRPDGGPARLRQRQRLARLDRPPAWSPPRPPPLSGWHTARHELHPACRRSVTGARLHPQGPVRRGRQPVRLPGRQGRRGRLLPVRLLGHLHRRAARDPRRPRRLPERRRPGAGRLLRPDVHAARLGRRAGLLLPAALATSGRTARSPRAYGVFDEQAGSRREARSSSTARGSSGWTPGQRAGRAARLRRLPDRRPSAQGATGRRTAPSADDGPTPPTASGRACSSVGRAPRLHRGCRRFEPGRAHVQEMSSQ